MRYIWESGKDRQVMHIQRHTTSEEPLMEAICGISHNFNRSINAPFGLGKRVYRHCLNKLKERPNNQPNA